MWLGKANAATPIFNRMDPNIVWDRLWRQELFLFRFLPPREGVILMEIVERNGEARIQLLAVAGRKVAHLYQGLGMALRELADHWGCSAVETMVVDPRLARAIMRSGARPESVTLVLQVGER